MLAIRMQRTGRKGYPMYRVVVQESHRQPTSGRVVANLGSYNPHTKENTLKKEEVAKFLKNGAQPSDRVVKLLLAEKIELPSWVKVPTSDKQKSIRNAEKLRKNQPKEDVSAEEVVPDTSDEVATPDTQPEEAPVEA
jgi:small subunit ribosomal protein S16